MDDINMNKARSLFREYQGQHQSMADYGDYALYRSYEISHETEQRWAREEEEELLGVFLSDNNIYDRNSFKLIKYLSNYFNSDIFGNMLEIVARKFDKLCTFTKVRIAEGLCMLNSQYDEGCLVHNDCSRVLAEARTLAERLLQSAYREPFVLDSRYKLEKGYARSTLEEKSIRDRIVSDMKENGILPCNENAER